MINHEAWSPTSEMSALKPLNSNNPTAARSLDAAAEILLDGEVLRRKPVGLIVQYRMCHEWSKLLEGLHGQ